MMKGFITKPMPFHEAERLLAELIKKSRSFQCGSNPVIGRLKTSYGCNRIIGITSFDNKVYTRLDYDFEKGFHFHFIDYNSKDKICIMIEDMNEKQYQRYINHLSKGRMIQRGGKRPVLLNVMNEEVLDVSEEEVLTELPPPSPYYDLIKSVLEENHPLQKKICE